MKQPKFCASCVHYIYELGELLCEKREKPSNSPKYWPNTSTLDTCSEYVRAQITGLTDDESKEEMAEDKK